MGSASRNYGSLGLVGQKQARPRHWPQSEWSEWSMKAGSCKSIMHAHSLRYPTSETLPDRGRKRRTEDVRTGVWLPKGTWPQFGLQRSESSSTCRNDRARSRYMYCSGLQGRVSTIPYLDADP